MPEPVRATITALLLTFVAVGGYYRSSPSARGRNWTVPKKAGHS
jgi:hypothetical protein